MKIFRRDARTAKVPVAVLPAVVLLGLVPTLALPAVLVTPAGFQVKHEATVNVSPAKAYDAIVKDVASWWDPDHTFSGDAKNLSIDARPGGCFCEKLPDGGGVEHLRVVYVAPGQMLRMSGGLGPFQGSGVMGAMTWKLTPDSTGTKVQLTYSAGGFMEGGFENIAPIVDEVLGGQFARYKRFVETGPR